MGYYVVKKMSLRQISWFWSSSDKGPSKLRSTARKFKPYEFRVYEYKILSSLRRFFGVLAHVAIILAVDCANFFGKTVLQIPPEHDILKYRILIWVFIATGASQEFYEWIVNPYIVRPGAFVWVTFFMMSMEYMLIIQHHTGKSHHM